MDCTTTATVAIPTRMRAGYLDVALASIAPQAAAAGAEVLVISDGQDPDTAEVARHHRARLETLPAPRGLNAARNVAVAASAAELVVFVDDDVLAPAGWLEAILSGVDAAPEVEVFGGPIRPLLEGGGPRACGREPAPITALDRGPADIDGAPVWGANMAIRRRALQRLGPFDESLGGRGDEEEWLRRYAAAGGRIRYLAAAGLEHRRTAADARLRPLSIAAYHLGRTARANDVRKGAAPPLARELRELAGGAWHAVRRRCAYGIVFIAHAAGRLREALAQASGSHGAPAPASGSHDAPGPAVPAPGDDFLSGASGYVAGIRATTRARAVDTLTDARQATWRWALRRAAHRSPPRRVLVLAVERADAPNLLDRAVAELRRSRHELEVARTPVAGRGKFENLNALLAGRELELLDWLLVLDDDVVLPRDFLDEFVFLAERFALAIAQPAHRAYSHAAWPVTRRRRGSVARETAFVEIGPVVAFHARTFAQILPFPSLRAGWGLDAHWSAVAAEQGWRIGVIDATAVEPALRPVAATYDAGAAIEEARRFLANRPYVRAREAGRTLATHRHW